jgi:hypothetical protein
VLKGTELLLLPGRARRDRLNWQKQRFIVDSQGNKFDLHLGKMRIKVSVRLLLLLSADPATNWMWNRLFSLSLSFSISIQKRAFMFSHGRSRRRENFQLAFLLITRGTRERLTSTN